MALSFKPLWKLLIDKDVKQKDLSVKAGLSAGTLQRMRKGENVSLKVINDICRELDCTPNDIIEYIPD